MVIMGKKNKENKNKESKENKNEENKDVVTDTAGPIEGKAAKGDFLKDAQDRVGSDAEDVKTVEPIREEYSREEDKKTYKKKFFISMPRLDSHWFKGLPNRLTWSRIALIPVFVLLAPWDKLFLNYLAALVFAVAALTDFFDGYLARKLNASSRFGEILDPLSDKALFVSAAVVLASRYPAYIPLFVVLVVREVMVMGLRALSLERGQNISVSGFGKVKTVCLDVAVVCLVIGPSSETFKWMPLGFLCLLVGTGLSLYSGWGYFRQVLRHEEALVDEDTSFRP